MSDLVDATNREAQDDPITFGEALDGALLLITVAGIWVLTLFSLDDTPHGTQLATLIGYSGVIFFFTFRRYWYVRPRYSLRAQYVKHQLPRLLLIHCVYLLVLYVVVGWVLVVRRQLPGFVFEFGPALIATSQVILSRRILSRAKDQSASQVAAEG